ncbi:substrate-binding family protein [Paraburkholderia sp. GV068]|uniref:helical backbone metal receptor n=1 Tax=unclassified Paraburkholderia TaxID=2615204 RepID=UPI000D31302B|nr:MULTISPECIES: helical backbone metal receptor [unclassified Paraburkholderia]PTQ96426.1 substrate-binding family protein [Paraburkholderia sp. GV072]PUB00838.1 substrate-binding family protein [Paraburkholderia sp. GV068]
MSACAVDAAGVAHEKTGAGARIVSLVPSITELLFALGLERQVVGRTGFCVHPRDKVRNVPKVGGTKAVKVDAVRALRPTHLIVNIDENERDTVEQLRAFVPHVVVTHPLTPHDNFSLYALLGAIFDREHEAQRLADALQARLHDAATHAFAAQNVLYLIWREPWMTVARDTYISAMLRVVNWQTLPEVQGGATGVGRYPSFGFDDAERALWLASVDRILLSSEPYRFTQAHCDALKSDPRMAGKRIELIDGEMVSWYGVRAIDGIAYLMQRASAA